MLGMWREIDTVLCTNGDKEHDEAVKWLCIVPVSASASTSPAPNSQAEPVGMILRVAEDLLEVEERARQDH